MSNYQSNPIIVAIDKMNKQEAIETMKELGRSVFGYKISSLILYEGHGIFNEIHEEVGSVNLFVDLILSGPAEKIRGEILPCLNPDVRFISVNFTSGVKGIRAAVGASKIAKILVYSIDSSLSAMDIGFIFNTPFRYIQTFKAAKMVREAGAYGLYCAAHELEFLSHPDFTEIRGMPIVAVGVRPKWFKDKGVHEFVMTPAEAMARGATKLVIGSPITKARNKLKAVEKIMEEIKK